MPEVTVAIPFNGGRIADFRMAVRSVFAQTVRDWRLILLDDGAPAELARAADAITDRRVCVVRDGENRGLAARLNQAAELANTQFLARMDADDVMMPNRLERQLRVLVEDPSIDVVGGTAFAIDEDDSLLGRYKEGPLPANQAGFLRSNGFTHPTVTGRTEWFRHNPYDPNIRRAEDKELWLRTFPHSRFSKLDDEPVLLYRVAGQFDRRKNVRTCRDDRNATVPYALRLGGWRCATSYWCTSMAKQLTYQVAGPLVWKRVRDSRVDRAGRDESARAVASAAAIRAIEVLGWDR